MTTVFIDGESGTTGLRLRDRLLGRTDIELLSLSAQERRSTEARRDMMKQADITVLCLPDGASREAVSLAEGTGTRLLDASSAHRTEPGWVYGCPELQQAYPEAIARAGRVSVPGCHATGVVLMLAPLNFSRSDSSGGFAVCYVDHRILRRRKKRSLPRMRERSVGRMTATRCRAHMPTFRRTSTCRKSFGMQGYGNRLFLCRLWAISSAECASLFHCI